MRTLILLSLVFATFTVAKAQTLTPGAAAIGGTTSSGQLIGVNGNSTGSSATTTTTTTTTRSTGSSGTTRRNPRLHYSNPNWVVPQPPVRVSVNGQPISAFAPATALETPDAGNQATQPLVEQPVTQDPVATTAAIDPNLSPVFDPNATPTNGVVEDTDPEPQSTNSNTAANTSAATNNSTGDTTAVTAAADPDQGTTSQPENSPELTASTGASAFRMTALNFAGNDINLTDDHGVKLASVVNLMRDEPNVPLRVVAVLAQADANNEDAKLLARRRILAVRSHILGQGLTADNLTFVISANSTTQQFANHVIIQR